LRRPKPVLYKEPYTEDSEPYVPKSIEEDDDEIPSIHHKVDDEDDVRQRVDVDAADQFDDDEPTSLKRRFRSR